MENFNERPNREIEYTPDFKEVIAQNPGALKSFLKLENEIEESSEEVLESREEKVFEDGEVRLTPLYQIIRRRNIYSAINGREKFNANSYCKVEIGDKAYFVKTIPGYFRSPEESTGIDEYRTTNKIKELFSEIKGVEVVEPKLGYSDKDKGVSYFVSEWKDLPRIKDYISKRYNYEGLSFTDAYEPIEKRLIQIRDIADKYNILDNSNENMFYDEENDVIYLYDMFDNSNKN
jgi:hypothetical protein